jgi:hypothetical protein
MANQACFRITPKATWNCLSGWRNLNFELVTCEQTYEFDLIKILKAEHRLFDVLRVAHN